MSRSLPTDEVYLAAARMGQAILNLDGALIVDGKWGDYSRSRYNSANPVARKAVDLVFSSSKTCEADMFAKRQTMRAIGPVREAIYSTTAGSSAWQGLIVKTALTAKGEVEATAGGTCHPGVLAFARKLQDTCKPYFRWFSAFNDATHRKSFPGSLHCKGLALDCSVTTNAKYPECAKHATDILLAAGLTHKDFLVLDEFTYPRKTTRGSHIHMQFNSVGAADKFLNS